MTCSECKWYTIKEIKKFFTTIEQMGCNRYPVFMEIKGETSVCGEFHNGTEIGEEDDNYIQTLKGPIKRNR